MLTTEERERYDRQIMIQGVGEEGQERLKEARVIIAGGGGLGSHHDTVELSNLNRQVLHWDEDIGRSKVESATEKLKRINPGIEVEAIEETITEKNVSRLVAGFDVIVDAMDNLPTRYLLNKAALEHNIPFFHGAIYAFEGRAMTIIPGKTACLRCVYRGVIPEEKFPVIGVTPAVIGSIQATEVIKYLVGVGELLGNKLLIYDGLSMQFTELRVKKDPLCEHCGQVTRKE